MSKKKYENQGNMYECKTRFTFYLHPEDEKKLLNYSVSGKFDNFEEFDLWLLNEKEVLNFFKKAVWSTFHETKITNLGKPKRVGQGYIGDKQIFNKLTNTYEIQTTKIFDKLTNTYEIQTTTESEE